MAKYNAEELLSKRESVSTRIRDELTHRAKQFHLIMDDVSITHLTFGHEFTKAIENKQARRFLFLLLCAWCFALYFGLCVFVVCVNIPSQSDSVRRFPWLLS